MELDIAVEWVTAIKLGIALELASTMGLGTVMELANTMYRYCSEAYFEMTVINYPLSLFIISFLKAYFVLKATKYLFQFFLSFLVSFLTTYFQVTATKYLIHPSLFPS